MPNQNKIIEKKAAISIQNKLENKLSSLSISKQRHYAERLYRITGHKKYVEPIKNYCLVRKKQFLDLTEALDKPELQKKYGHREIDYIKKSRKGIRFQRRLPVYREIPEFKYFQSLVWYFDKFSDYKVLGTFLPNKQKEQILKKLKEQDFKKYFLNDKLMLVDPVQTINTVYNLRNINIIDLTEEVFDFVDNIFRNKKTSENYQNKLYFYTHVLIAETKYYQDFIKDTDHKRIFNFFKNETNKILNLENNDIIAEIGVCYKLARKGKEDIVRKIKERILEDLDENNGLLLREKDKQRSEVKISKIEHRNVLAIMLLSKFDHLYKGPIINL